MCAVRTGNSDQNVFSEREWCGVDVGVLGPLILRSGTRSNAPSASKPRNVLATLAVNAGQVVSVSLLMRELWDDEPPVSGLTTLQTYILNLRKLMSSVTGLPPAQVARELLLTRPGGYLFQIGAGTLDLRRYFELVDAGRAAFAVGDDEEGVRRLDDALRLWRGPALVDVTGGRVLESRRRQLEESRLVVLEHMVDARLRLGMYHGVLTELVALTVENPLHEGLHAQYMRALYSLGRRAEALEVFWRLRQNLVDELGLEPGLSVQRVHAAILSSEKDVIPDPNPQRTLPDSLRSVPWESGRAY